MEKTQFTEKVAAFSQKHQLFTQSDNILVTLSGGADSVALLLVLRELGIKCTVAHCNFHLRGEESMRDENFVRNISARLNIKYIVKNFDVPKYVKEHSVSVEMACRELRYEWFEELREQENLQYIAVAHHHNDNIETFFLNIFRGTGIAGLAAIKPKNGLIIRPLLSVTRSEIEEFVTNCGESFIIDSTNAENDYKRNKIRNIIIPTIIDLFPDAETGISRTIDNLFSCNEVYQNAINYHKDNIEINHNHLVKRINLEKLRNITGCSTILFEILKEYGFNFSQVEDIISLDYSKSTGKHFLSEKYDAIINRNFIDITFIANYKTDTDKFPITISNDVTIDKPINLKVTLIPHDKGSNLKATSPNIAFFSTKLMNKELALRHWHNGDRFTPFGMHGSKKLSDLFTDLKLSLNEKNDIWVLTADDDIMWVIGLRTSNKLIPSTTDTQLLRIEYFPTNA
ncbi:MAG: tRNA lysidine(34) synthetase TilS [Muribaculaceae bacterium]